MAGLQPGTVREPRKKLTEGVQAFYWRPPAPEELEAYGLTPDDYPEPEIGIWPESWQAFQLFTRLSTQWRVGAAGAIGLDYNVLFHEMDRAGLAGDNYDETFSAIRVIESVA